MPGVAARAFGVLGSANINIQMIAQGSSELNLSIVVRQKDAPRAVQLIHEAFELGALVLARLRADRRVAHALREHRWVDRLEQVSGGAEEHGLDRGLQGRLSGHQQHRDVGLSVARDLEGLAGRGRRLAGYGAPAKGNTLLNYCGIDTRLVPYTVDKNALKVGLYTPGAHIPVRPVSALTEPADAPEYLLLLAWNFADEVMRQQQRFREHGGRFILPIPEPRVV